MSGDCAQTVAALKAAITALQQLDMSRCGRDELLSLLRDLEVEHNRLAALDADLVGELDSRGIAGEVGARDTRALLMHTLHLSALEAGARVNAARQLSARRTLGGEVIPAQHPHVAAALKTGSLNPARPARSIAPLPRSRTRQNWRTWPSAANCSTRSSSTW